MTEPKAPATTMADQQANIQKANKRPLSQSEAETIKDEQRSLQDILNEPADAGAGTKAEGTINRVAIKSQIDRLQAFLDQAPGDLTPGQKDACRKREKELEKTLKVGIPTRWEMDHPAKCPGAVRKHLNWLDRNNHLIEEYRDIQRLLNPGEEKSVEQLRKDR